LFGSLNKSLVYKIIQKSNCIVITSLDEGFSIVMLEAFMFKKPLLATPVADIPKIVKDSENGMIIDYSAKNLADTIASLYHNRRFADTIAENGYKTFLTINNLQKNLHQTELIFRKNFSSD
jgi:glycosyltransferase involved in cell wall biosynthesis